MRFFWALILVLASRAGGAEYFVAVDGDDSNGGTIEKPFASLARGQAAAVAGDTVWIRGGRYVISEGAIAKREKIWAYVTLLDKSGEKGKAINYFAYQDERPVFDFSKVRPEGLRVNAFQVNGSWIHLRGIEVVGVQVTIKGHTQSECFENQGSDNVFERLSTHDGQAIGIYSVRGSNNLFLNCDSYRNHDFTSEDGKGGNVDGFGCHPTKGSVGNVFRGCRAWFNSDDGFDCINSHEAVRFENCWAFYNGYSTKFERLGDGNGFKAGGYGTLAAARLPDPIPRHVVERCVAVGNRANGFYANHHIGGGDWVNNTGYRNGRDFNMLCRLGDNKTDVAGYGQRLWNNVGFKGGDLIANLDLEKSELLNNSFDLKLVIGAGDFLSLDEGELVKERGRDGALPVMKFLRPGEGSVLVRKDLVLGAFAR